MTSYLFRFGFLGADVIIVQRNFRLRLVAADRALCVGR